MGTNENTNQKASTSPASEYHCPFCRRVIDKDDEWCGPCEREMNDFHSYIRMPWDKDEFELEQERWK